MSPRAKTLEPALLSVADACTYLGIGRTTLYKISAARGDGELPVVCIAGKRLFRKADLDRYIAAHTS